MEHRVFLVSQALTFLCTHTGTRSSHVSSPPHPHRASKVAMAATTVASAATSSLHLASSPSEPKVLPRRGLCLLAPGKASSPLKLVSNCSRVSMSADRKKEVTLVAPVALAVLAAAVIPDMAEAVAPGVSPSLKNLLLSVVAGGIVLVAIGGAVAAVSTFDPVKRK